MDFAKPALLDAALSEWLAGTLRKNSGLASLCAFFPTGNAPERHRLWQFIERHSPCCRKSAYLFGIWRMHFDATTEWLAPDCMVNVAYWPFPTQIGVRSLVAIGGIVLQKSPTEVC